MTRRSIVAAISIFIHAIVLGALMTADFWRPISEWPTPRSAMAFVDNVPRAVRLEDIVVPPEGRRNNPGAPASPLLTHAIEPAPLAPPSGVTTETGREGVAQANPVDVGGVEAGVGNDIVGVGIGAALPPPPTQTPVRLNSGIRPPQRIVNVTPAYPAIARSAHVEGVVIIEATIDEHGNVIRAQVLRSIPLLDDAALQAVRQWKFSPTTLNGIAVPIVMTVTVNFTLQ